NYMKKNYRFETFVNETMHNKEFEKIFKNNSNPQNLLKQFYRKVYHKINHCDSLTSDYHEDLYFKNTGVFLQDSRKQEIKFYYLKKEFLDQLGMRECKNCH